MQIKDNIIFITGSSDRVGKTIALKLARAGGKIILHYHRNREKATKTAGRIASSGIPPLIVQGNIALEKDWLRMKKEIMAVYGRIDVLINNAAIFYKTPLFRTSGRDWNNFMDINLKSIFWAGKIFGETMFKQKSGRIINIADVAGETIWPGYIPYCVSKAGVFALTRGLAKALAPHVLVNCIAPGTVMLAESYDNDEEQALISRTPLKRIGTPEDIANAAAFLIEGGDFITGTTIKVDGGRSLT
ncbi:MAG: SDR family NAD(P)-dependent oxidoreductase [Calditrichia bacterium]